MIMRGLLSLAVVALFMPHEPGLGFGQPAIAATIAPAEDWTGRDARHVDGGCGAREGTCGQAVGLLAQLESISYQSADAVRADLAEAERERADAHRNIPSAQKMAATRRHRTD
jgi:hypothetical protein